MNKHNNELTPGEEKIYFNFLGMRTIKTVVAVFICLIISYFKDFDPMNSIVAAIVCMKNNPKLSLNSGIDRIIGTLVGGLYGYLTILIARYLNIKLLGLFYYAYICIMLIPVIYTNIYLNTSESVSIAAIVFFSVTVSMALKGDVQPLLLVIRRVFETFIGIVVAVFVNTYVGANKKPNLD